jgi:peptide/nickel transport system permease protein
MAFARLPKKRRADLLLTCLLSALFMIGLSYFLPKLLPGDFVTAMFAASEDIALTAEQEEELRAYYRQQEGFGRYLLNLVQLNWGYSYAFSAPVSQLFFEALPWSMLLLISANVLALLAGFIAGVEAASRRNSRFERSLVGGSTILEGIPEICTSVILLALFALHLGWFPAAGAETAYADFTAWERFVDILHHLALPLFALFLAYFPGNFLVTRSSMVMVISQAYIKTAQAKGLSRLRIRYAHAARNCLLPLVTRFGLRLAFTLTGAFVVERLHSYPGLGTLLFNAIHLRDLPVIQSVVLVASLMVLLVIMVLELIYSSLDPRVSHAP